MALTGKQYSAKVAASNDLLSQVRERFQSVEDQFRAVTEYGFDVLTESEARYLAKHDSPQSVRDRIIEAGSEASGRADRGIPRYSAGGNGVTDTATYGPAPQAHRDAAARLSAGFGQRVAGGSDANLLDAVAPSERTARGRAAASVAATARLLFNREVVYVKFRGKAKVGILNYPGGKPKGMHWKTFARLQATHNKHSDTALACMADSLLAIRRHIERLN
jgi:hypothetical protein